MFCTPIRAFASAVFALYVCPSLQPSLQGFITYARNLPLYGKIRGSDDMLRKHAIRDLALKIGVPEISARKRKKALQYGTLIHKNLIKSKLLRE